MYGHSRGPDPEVTALERITLHSPDGLDVAFVPGAGMVGTSMTLDGVELLGRRGGLPSYISTGSTYGIPLLAPWANRLGEIRQCVGDIEWAVPTDASGVHCDDLGQAMHGLLAAAPEWVLEQVSADDAAASLRARLCFDARLARFVSFPFAHDLIVEARLTGLTLTVTTSLTPTSSRAVPVTFGWHPYVAFLDVPRREWEVVVPFLRHAELDARTIPTGVVLDLPIESGALGTRVLDDLYVDLSDGIVASVRGGSRSVSTRYVSGYPVGVIWAPASLDVVCIEPMTAPTDPFSGRWPLRMAAPGESVAAVFEMTAARH